MKNNHPANLLNVAIAADPDLLTRCDALKWLVDTCWRDVKQLHLVSRNYIHVWLLTYLTKLS